MYYVVDESKLSSEAGYSVYTAGTATAVPWSGVTGKPSSYPPASHNHDERYYTETEMNSKLAEKAPKVHTHVKSEVGLGNVDNTADANKSVKYAASAGTAASCTGNAATATTATKLATARSINGTNFDGSGNITTATWGTARNITIGSTKKSVNGGADVSWSLGEIGAAAASHSHSYLPLSGGTLTGNLNLKPASGEGGEIHLDASTANRTENGIILDQQGGNFRIFGVPSADGKTKTGYGTPLVINPYSKTITGGYTLTGALSGNASSASSVPWTGVTGRPSSLPASDVYAWAKASSKPSYSWGEITGKPGTFTPAGHSHYSLTTIGDQRSTATSPNSYSNNLIFQGLKGNSTIGISNAGNYSYVLGLRGWNDSSGGNSHELAFNNSGIYTRNGATSWGTWKQLLDSSNYTSYTVTKSGSGASGTWSINVTGSAGSVAWGNVSGKPSTYTPSSHTHNYLPLSGGTMSGTAMITWPDSGNWSNSNKNVTFPVIRGGLSWTGQSDGIQLYAVETGNDNLELYLKFTDDNSNGLSVRNKDNTQTARISATGEITASKFVGNLAGTASSASAVPWSGITGKPSTFTPASHTHNYAGSSSAGGNANAAVKLATARSINGTNFDGSGNITTANWGTARTITVGNTGKSVNGSGNVSWSLGEIGVHVSNKQPTASDGKNGDVWIVYEG